MTSGGPRCPVCAVHPLDAGDGTTDARSPDEGSAAAVRPRRRRSICRSCDDDLGLSSSGSPHASGDPTASGPIGAHSSRRNHNHNPGRRRRSADRPSPSRRDANRRDASRRARTRRKRMSAPTRPHRAKPRLLQLARVCVTWWSPQVQAPLAPSVNCCPVAPPKPVGARSIEAYLRQAERNRAVGFRQGSCL